MAEDKVSLTKANREIFDLNSVPNSDESTDNRFRFLTNNGMVQLQEWQHSYEKPKNMFLGELGLLGRQTSVVAIHQNTHSSWSGNFRFQSHQILLQAVFTNRGGNTNYIWGWYGASKDDISAIVSHGFTRPDEPVYGRRHGVGIHLSSPRYLLHEIEHSTPDEEGIRHIFTCYAIMGRTEVIGYGSKQFKPSSVEFDTGVDNLFVPKIFIVWSAYMNSHLKPDLVISFRSPTLKNNSRTQLCPLMPRPPMPPVINYSSLIPILEILLEPSKFRRITKQHDLLKQGKIPSSKMIHVVRQIAGDELLKTLAKYYKKK